jgi:DNA-binding transcriptional MerR regulator
MPAKQATDSSLMRISAAAEAAGVSKQTVEYYILIGLVEPIRKGPHRRRFFDKALVKRIRLIRRLNDSGYTLRSIRETYLRRR